MSNVSCWHRCYSYYCGGKLNRDFVYSHPEWEVENSSCFNSNLKEGENCKIKDIDYCTTGWIGTCTYDTIMSSFLQLEIGYYLIYISNLIKIQDSL